MHRISLRLALPFLVACAANPKPGEPGYPYNLSGPYQVEVVVQGTPYHGMMDLSMEPGGALGGTFQVIDPVQVGGSIEGTIAALGNRRVASTASTPARRTRRPGGISDAIAAPALWAAPAARDAITAIDSVSASGGAVRIRRAGTDRRR